MSVESRYRTSAMGARRSSERVTRYTENARWDADLCTECRPTSRGCHQTLGHYLAQSLKRVFVLEPGPLLLHPRGPVSHDGDRLRSVQAWRQREDSLTVGGNVVPVVVPVQQRSEQRMHLSGLK